MDIEIHLSDATMMGVCVCEDVYVDGMRDEDHYDDEMPLVSEEEMELFEAIHAQFQRMRKACGL